MPTGLQAFGSESIFDIIAETGVVVNKLLNIVTKFEEDSTEQNYIDYPDLENRHAKAVAALQKIKAVVPQIPTFKIDTPIDFWKLTPIPADSPDLVVWKALENLIIPFNIDIEDPVMRAMIWLGYTFEPNTSGTDGMWTISPDKADLRIRVLESISKGIDGSLTSWSKPWEEFRDAILNTPIYDYISDDFKTQMVYVMGGKLLAKVKLYLDRVNNLAVYLNDFSKDCMLLVEALPEGWNNTHED
ncbi:hypothetical protein TWF481_004926 [Arthrobotrys musiformis]|uniref:Uncharacterized protein n=1 Tax=Arthrobotrys musiformis TaxID=47236 RepID=A0AAV9WKZ3_9PEZI